jgi:putative ATPase
MGSMSSEEFSVTDSPGLFGPDVGRIGGGLQPPGDGAPLAARMRPRTLDEFVGQDRLVGSEGPLRELIERDRVPSLILWGPPGCGKTTLAAIMASRTGAWFEPFSAVTEGVPRVRELIAQAAERKRAGGADTILFVDEIHRFNRAQQDAFLPHVEAGTIVLVGATTENPSFEVVGPLLSRTRVFVLDPLGAEALESLLIRALTDSDRGLGKLGLEIDPDALRLLAASADGDARRALNALETAAELVEPGGRIGTTEIERGLQRRFPRYDKSGEEHYNLISALHKAVRGSDPDGALYWLARMLEGGENPMFVARRLVRMAVEDVGLADPGALRIALAARDAYHFLGSPEGELALAEACLYLAVAPKSNRVYRAFTAASRAARDTPAEPVPLHIRNAPTGLMKDLGYGAGYRYDHDWAAAVAPQRYLPDSLTGATFYEPGDQGVESRIAIRMQEIDEARARARQAQPGSEPSGTDDGEAGD